MVKFLGKPFVERGRDIETGLDCWGLAIEVFREYGIALPDFVIDSFAFQTIDMLAGKELKSRLWEEVYSPSDKDVPLIVLMRIHPRWITHAGVLITGNRIIHTMKKTGVIVSKVSSLKPQIVGYYRLCSG
ncbi:MAG: C40 family peptidase [Candidatus Bathyarchaeota archaeon]|nr:C40 family peptidase [Candidatus Bathyarchaeota archaeon]